ncbi:MAG: proline dehydrogenase family protein [Pirellulaceae bacterium]|jgi:RHH-type proline utilization regulon transcriptional repressor/proline dehydrogenase/delta 1-pyrroline-5-carboxylate dehydrogenase|nr:proline dehydrogenase family protein [Pirellulaceae bacterium]
MPSLSEFLAELPIDSSSQMPPSVQRAIALARHLQTRATELQTPQERKQQTELDRMIHAPHDKATLAQLTDQAFRSQTAHRAADQLVHILDVQGVPRFFSPLDRTLLKGFQSFGSYLPGVAVPLVKEKMRKETANVILPAEPALLAEHLRARRDEGVRMNVNFLGEALLGEDDAEERLKSYLTALQQPEIEVISVKISTIYSQISHVGREHTIAVLCDRLELLFRAAARETFVRSDGSETHKLVYLDMEEYRDMEMTADVFMETLDRPGLETAHGGIALQAYIPDSYTVQRRLLVWARSRVARGGSAITMRIVKGANMEMERVESSLQGWPTACFLEKIDTDANYKRMLHECLLPENRTVVRVGVASHNLFDVSYALVRFAEDDALERVQFEMLEGMANHQRRALFDFCEDMLLYAPACRREHFVNAIGYLIRRLDENTGPDNFLRHAFCIQVGSEEWRRLEQGFADSFERIESLPMIPRRSQDRSEFDEPADMPRSWTEFVNEPNTDFSLEQNLRWLDRITQRWSALCGDRGLDVPLEIGGEQIRDRPVRGSIDPSRPGVVVGKFRLANRQDIDGAVATAQADPSGWRTLDVAERSRTLAAAAQTMRETRGELIGAALAEAGKTVLESDPEISEAIDFLEFYHRTAEDWFTRSSLRARPAGVVAVVSPWNFPIAIPCGGVAAALAAGNTVILKPASDTVLTAYLMCECLWDAGVPREALQFVPCSGAEGGAHLVGHAGVDVVVLTGGTETAVDMLNAKPSMRLLAETGGKNSTIVTALADRDQAIRHVLQSAFGHSGQKCSATSLLILEQELFEDESFRQTLCDAVQSIRVGSAWDHSNRMGPLIRRPTGDLEKGLKELEHGESWAVLPHIDEDNPHLVSPGVKWGVQPGSFTHLTELFGPQLGVMCVRNLTEAIYLANQTGFGLTAGIETLDDREQEQWLESIVAGNLYVNRSTTGAIVLRQPFGGMGKSAFGPGIKAGGPNYVAALMEFSDADVAPADSLIDDVALRALSNEVAECDQLTDADRAAIKDAIGSFDREMRDEFQREHDHFGLLGQDNLRRYLPIGEYRIRVHADDTPFEIIARVAAARAAGCRITVSSPPELDSPTVAWLDQITEPWAGDIEFCEESDEELIAVIQHQVDRLRYAQRDRPPESVRRAVIDPCIYIADAPVLADGRLELLWCLEEQSVCIDYHRYGNLGERATPPESTVRTAGQANEN